MSTQTPIIVLDTVHETYLQAQLDFLEIRGPLDMYIIPPGHQQHFNQGLVLRYSLQYHDGERRGFIRARQGRHTYSMLTPAESALNQLRKQNDSSRLALYGGAKAMFVAFTACYGGHYDPAPVDLDCTPIYHADLRNLQIIRRLMRAIDRCRRDYDPAGTYQHDVDFNFDPYPIKTNHAQEI